MKKILVILLVVLFGIATMPCDNLNNDDAYAADEISGVDHQVQDDNTSLTLEEKVYGVSMIWKEAEYNFVFWDKLKGLNWDDAYNETLTRVIRTEDTREYYLELMRFISLLRDGHTGVWFPDEIYEQYGHLPISVKYCDGKYIIINTDENLKDMLYCEITKINDLPVQQYLEERIYPYCWHEKLESANYALWRLIPMVEAGNDVNIETNNGAFTTKTTTEDIAWVSESKVAKTEELTSIFASETLEVGITTDNIAVITIPTFADDNLISQFYKILPQVKDCEGFIVDVRWNGGGSSGNADAVAQAFIDGEFANSRHKVLTHNALYKAWGRQHMFLEEASSTTRFPDCPAYIEAPLVVLENSDTGSSAEDFLVVLDNIHRATIVGTASYGSTGQPLLGTLPGGGGFRICTRWCLYPNGKEFMNSGIAPHIYADLSVDDYRNNVDSVFEKALVALRKQIDNMKP